MIKHKILTDSFFYITGSTIQKIFLFVSGILLMKYLAVEIYGKYNYIVEFIAIFSFFSDGGLKYFFVREMSKDLSNRNNLYKTIQGNQV